MVILRKTGPFHFFFIQSLKPRPFEFLLTFQRTVVRLWDGNLDLLQFFPDLVLSTYKTTVFRPVCCLVILCCDSIGLQNCRSSNFSSHQHMTVQQKKHKWSQLRHLHEYFILPDGITCKVQNFSSLVIGVYFMLGLLYMHLSPNSL